MSFRPKGRGGDRIVRRRLSVISWFGCRYLLAVVFLMAAVSKLTDLRTFAAQVERDSGLPDRVNRIVGVVLPWLELTCGACLALGQAVREAALVLSILLVALLIYALTHLGASDCHCFLFPGREPQWAWWGPVQNALLLACAVYVSLSPRAKERQP
jgi:uncharacterized membrane protein YphA (DoxX/SURF4 family)